MKKGFTPYLAMPCRLRQGCRGANKKTLENPRLKKRGAGFTLIEAIMVIAIIAILSVSGAWLMVYLVQNSVFIPNQLNMDMVASEALKIMIEGDDGAKGLRFSKSITAVASNQVTFNNQDGQNIRYRLDTVANKLYRSINAGAEQLMPYYLTTGVSVLRKSNKLFTYYDANEIETAVAVDVRRIKISLIAQTGTGQYADWEGQSDQSSAIAVSKFQ